LVWELDSHGQKAVSIEAGPFFIGDWRSRIIYNVVLMKLRNFYTVVILAMLAPAIFAVAMIARADSITDKLGAPSDGKSAMVRSGDVQAVIKPAVTQAAAGQDIKVSADFTIASGWHIYGKPISTDYVPTAITFDDGVVAKQSIDFPKPEMMKFEALGQTLPVYKGSMHAGGNVKLRPDLKPGDYKLSGKVEFQECSDNICKMPQSLPFEIPITIASSAH
jgi:DsbC/DsbD-like thiol-disulfide interchange protein